MKTAKEVRAGFLEYFSQAGHTPLPSGPLVPANDPTLMFANAGMVQFKDVFTGKEKRPYVRAASSQKCIRISGKHNDLENVGVTARHHTFFEMLGNFSFGDYFKEDAIRFAWQFITEHLQLPKERLVVTVFGGENELQADDEAARIWAAETGFDSSRIIRCGAKDNFWSMGDTGPCGPCTEIHYFHGDGTPDPARFGDEPGMDGAGWTELWNLVFMQFERHASGAMTSLPAPSIDTGAGLERLAATVEGVRSNYDTSLLRPIVDLAAEISGKAYERSTSKDDVSMRVIADHARTAAFLIAEGVFPDRDGRAYVLRRVMRRAIRHGHRLGIERLFLHECAQRVVDTMGDAYPELRERQALIAEITQQEEDRFRRTLRRGLDMLADDAMYEKHPETATRTLPGAAAFKLYDTYGFPLDLQDVIGEEQGFRVDHQGFETELEQAREKSAGSKVGEQAVVEVYHALAREGLRTTFTGYDRESGTSEILALLAKGAKTDLLEVPSDASPQEIVVKSSPFYGESGGQVGDRGVIRAPDGATFLVEDTVRPVEGLIVHRGRVSAGSFQIGHRVDLEVDHERRQATRRNHSATHLLHYALRTVLGPQAMQKGSLVGPDRLRFDYASARPLTREEILRIEDIVNEKTLANAEITTDVLPMDEAKKRGAIGIFEEKYGETVRMLTMTRDSIELCGGTHAARTGDLGMFKVISESGLAAGVRRIEAATGAQSIRHMRELEEELLRSASHFKGIGLRGVAEKVERILTREKELEREIEDLKRKLRSGGQTDLASTAKNIGGVNAVGAIADVSEVGELREIAESLRDKLAPAVVLLGAASTDGRAILVCAVSKDVTGRFAAGTIIKAAAKMVGGNGGGRPDFAQAGGTDVARLADAVALVYEAVGAS